MLNECSIGATVPPVSTPIGTLISTVHQYNGRCSQQHRWYAVDLYLQLFCIWTVSGNSLHHITLEGVSFDRNPAIQVSDKIKWGLSKLERERERARSCQATLDQHMRCRVNHLAQVWLGAQLSSFLANATLQTSAPPTQSMVDCRSKLVGMKKKTMRRLLILLKL